MREDRRDTPWQLAVAGRVIRWRARSHAQIWVLAASGYLVVGITFVLIRGWHHVNAVSVVASAVPWISGGLGQSHHLDRRRNG